MKRAPKADKPATGAAFDTVRVGQRYRDRDPRSPVLVTVLDVSHADYVKIRRPGMTTYAKRATFAKRFDYVDDGEVTP